jgi:hypothetical protein
MVAASHAPLHGSLQRSNFTTPPVASHSTLHAPEHGSHEWEDGSHAPALGLFFCCALPDADVVVFLGFFAVYLFLIFLYFYVTWFMN